MSRYMHNVINTGIVCLAIVLFTGLICFFIHIDHLKGDDVKIACIKSGKDWVINDKSDMDTPKYECR